MGSIVFAVFCMADTLEHFFRLRSSKINEIRKEIN